jgi:U3 small nucleolar ribonucleoprotein protein LCP5
MIEGRVVLEKIKVLESRMRYQIEKLVRVAEEVPSGKDVAEDPLAFRPNPQNLVDNEQDSDEDRDARLDVEDPDGIYRPPKLAPMPYTEAAADKRSKRQPVPKALSTLLHQDPSRPHIEGTSGLGSMPSLASDRAREIQRIKDFEEENFTRLVMKKKDARRRRKDEEDLALGGTGAGKGRKRGRGLEDEFADVLHSIGRTKAGVLGDGYEELRQRGKKADALSRSRTTWKGDLEGEDDDGPRLKKKTRFEKAKTTLHKKMKARKR